MTEYEKRSITNMRLQGKGYRSIASELGLSRDAVRNFCKSRKIDGYACSKDTGIINPLLWGKTICPTCGEPFEQPEIGRKRKYCSEECRRRYWSVHPEKQKLATHTFVCQYCGKEFQATGNDRKFCSTICYQKSKRATDEAFEKFVSQLINKEKIDSIPGWIAELIEDEILRRRGLRIIHQDKESRK